jgi:hypothetical protein
MRACIVAGLQQQSWRLAQASKFETWSDIRNIASLSSVFLFRRPCCFLKGKSKANNWKTMAQKYQHLFGEPRISMSTIARVSQKKKETSAGVVARLEVLPTLLSVNMIGPSFQNGNPMTFLWPVKQCLGAHPRLGAPAEPDPTTERNYLHREEEDECG